MADGAAVLAGIARAPGVIYAALAPEPARLRRRARRRRRRGGDLRLGLRELQPAATSTPRSPRAWSDSPRSPRRRAPTRLPLRGYVSCVTDCPFEGRIAPAAVAGGRGAAVRARLPRGRRSATPSATARPIGSTRCCGRCSRSPRRTGSRGTSTTPRARARQCRGGARGGPARLRRLVRRPRRLPLRAGRGGQRRDRAGGGAARGARLLDRPRPRPAGRGSGLRARASGRPWSHRRKSTDARRDSARSRAAAGKVKLFFYRELFYGAL